MTNPIPAQTHNGTFNAPDPFLPEVHRIAGTFGMRFGEFVRVAIVEAVAKHRPEDAAKLRAMLRDYYGKAASLCCALLLVGIAFSDQDVRRPSGARVRNGIRREAK